jgi:hypothetical protein
MMATIVDQVTMEIPVRLIKQQIQMEGLPLVELYLAKTRLF